MWRRVRAARRAADGSAATPSGWARELRRGGGPAGRLRRRGPSSRSDTEFHLLDRRNLPNFLRHMMTRRRACTRSPVWMRAERSAHSYSSRTWALSCIATGNCHDVDRMAPPDNKRQIYCPSSKHRQDGSLENSPLRPMAPCRRSWPTAICAHRQRPGGK